MKPRLDLSRFAPEEIAAVVLVLVLLLAVGFRPTAVTDMFMSPYATPDPEGGPPPAFLPRPTESPASIQVPPPANVETPRGTSATVTQPIRIIVQLNGDTCVSAFRTALEAHSGVVCYIPSSPSPAP